MPALQVTVSVKQSWRGSGLNLAPPDGACRPYTAIPRHTGPPSVPAAMGMSLIHNTSHGTNRV